MLRKLALVILPFALLAAACGGGGDTDGGSERDASGSPAASADADAGAQGGPAGPSDVVGDTDDGVVVGTKPSRPPASADDGDANDGDAGAVDALLGTLNPFQFLGDMEGMPMSQDVDPALKAALLDAGDLPPDFLSLGEFTFSLDSEVGTIEMAATQFSSGDMMADEFGTMVMSAAMTLPPEALEEMGDLSDLEGLTEADFEAMQAEVEEFGMEFAELELLDASGLGDGGFGMRLALDFGDLFAAFGEPEEEPGFTGISMEMYMFMRGDRMLMAMVMWSGDGPSGVDGRALAERMDDKADDAF